MTDPHKIRQYVLGDLPARSRRDLETRLLVEQDVAEQIEQVEDELIESYVRDTLEGGERFRFEERLRTNPVLAENVRLARVLRDRFVVGDPGAARGAGRVSWRSGARARTGWLAAAAALALVGVGLWLRSREASDSATTVANRPGVIEPSPEDASPPAASTPTPGARPPRVAALTLVPGRTMAGGVAQVALGPDVESLRIELVLEEPFQPSYSARLLDASGAPLWQARRLRPRAHEDGVLDLAFPAALLRRGEGYRIQLEPERPGAEGDASRYDFIVAR